VPSYLQTPRKAIIVAKERLDDGKSTGGRGSVCHDIKFTGEGPIANPYLKPKKKHYEEPSTGARANRRVSASLKNKKVGKQHEKGKGDYFGSIQN